MSRDFDDALGVVLAIAQALREEFGVGIDAHPGGEGTEAGSVNRAFLATTEAILSYCVTAESDLTDVLRQAALRRLTGLGLPADQADMLVGSNPSWATDGSPTWHSRRHGHRRPCQIGRCSKPPPAMRSAARRRSSGRWRT